jgi:dihydrofolate reductase
MRNSLIVAMSENRVIGRDGRLPWRLSADLQRFKRLTMGHHLVMGRKTWDSIGRPLPGRTSIVITRDPAFRAGEALVAHSIDQVAGLASGADQVFFIGGAEIYRQVLPFVERIYMTLVRAHIDGDTFFPAWDPHRWRLVESVSGQADERNQYDYDFLTYDRAYCPKTTS